MSASSFLALLRRRLPRDPKGRLAAAVSDPRVRLRAQVGLAAALIVGSILSILIFLGATTPLDPLLNDLVYRPMPAGQQVAIIAIDKKSLDALGPSPWPRNLYAELLGRLAPAQPRVVAFDLILSQSAADDAQLAAALGRNGNAVFATVGVEETARSSVPGSFPQFDMLLLPAPTLETPLIGHRLVTTDADGIVRRVPAAITDGHTNYPALGLLAARAYLGNGEIKYDLAQRQVSVGPVGIPVDEYGRMLVNFAGPSSGFATYSFVDVLNGQVPFSAFDHRLVIVGETTGAEAESMRLPLLMEPGPVPNVQVQADVAEMLIQSPPHVLQPQSRLDQIAFTILFALLAGLTLPHVRPLTAAAFTIVYLLVLFVIAFDAFNRGLVMRLLSPALGLLLCFLILATYRYLSEERRRHFVSTLFRRYLRAEAVPMVVDAVDRGELPLGGTRRMVSVLYCEIRGLSDLADGAPPEEVLELANLYLELMMLEMHGENGTINKPMGDALVAVWNAPLDQPDHACRAARTALSIRRSVVGIEKDGVGEGLVSVGFGLATGRVILGNVSTQGRVEYTLIGEAANTARRLSGAAEANQIVADAVTVRALPQEFGRSELPPIEMQGGKEPVRVWEIKEREEESVGMAAQVEA